VGVEGMGPAAMIGPTLSWVDVPTGGALNAEAPLACVASAVHTGPLLPDAGEGEGEG